MNPTTNHTHPRLQHQLRTHIHDHPRSPPSTSSNANVPSGIHNPLTVIRSASDNISSGVGNVFKQPKSAVVSDAQQQAHLLPPKLTGLSGGLWPLLGKACDPNQKKIVHLFSVAAVGKLYVRK